MKPSTTREFIKSQLKGTDIPNHDLPRATEDNIFDKKYASRWVDLLQYVFGKECS